jgi:hypothetical protein
LDNQWKRNEYKYIIDEIAVNKNGYTQSKITNKSSVNIIKNIKSYKSMKIILSKLLNVFLANLKYTFKRKLVVGSI